MTIPPSISRVYAHNAYETGKSDMFVIDWSKAPKEARWWAMDADGKAHWYCEPIAAAFTTFWYADMKDAPSFGFTGEWKESLRERPAK